MLVPNRHSLDLSRDYRYGYQGSEKDNELKGEANSYTTHYRMLDPRVGKWMSRDPKETAFESPYASMSNNPILFNDILGDSIKTKFYDVNKEKLNFVPNRVQKMFNEEYGIKVGYNSKTKMLYYDGEVETVNNVSSKAKNIIVNALKETDAKKIKSFGEVTFGYDLEKQNGAPGGILHGGSQRGTGLVGIDLADFNDDGSTKGYIYNNLPIRAYNMGRIFEHEWIGHILRGEGDNPASVRDDINPGGAVSVVNEFRIELGLPIRINYGASWHRDAIFFAKPALGKKEARQLAKEYLKRLDDFIFKGKGKVDDIPMLIAPKE